MNKVLVFLLLLQLSVSSAFGDIPEDWEVYYNASANSLDVWFNHYSEDKVEHRISKVEVLFDGRKFQVSLDRQPGWGYEFRTEVPLGDIRPAKNTPAKIRITCTNAGTEEFDYKF